MSEIFLCGGAADATVLSNVFIDEYLKDANDAQLKVYLFSRAPSAGRRSCQHFGHGRPL